MEEPRYRPTPNAQASGTGASGQVPNPSMPAPACRSAPRRKLRPPHGLTFQTQGNGTYAPRGTRFRPRGVRSLIRFCATIDDDTVALLDSSISTRTSQVARESSSRGSYGVARRGNPQVPSPKMSRPAPNAAWRVVTLFGLVLRLNTV